jgi:hypothetical protein
MVVGGSLFLKKVNLELPLNVLMNSNVQCCGSTVSASMTKYMYKESKSL